jgi:hypothetical protein
MVGDGMGKTVLVADTAVPGLLLFEPPGDLYGVHLADLSLRGGQFGVHVVCNTADWLVERVRFEAQAVAGFAGDSFDNGNLLVDCEFVGGKYGFVGGGWNRHFIDKTALWRCHFQGQSENGVRIAGDGEEQGLYLHTMLRDCSIRNSGGPGAVLMGHGALMNFLDHCLIENCGQRGGEPYLRFMKVATPPPRSITHDWSAPEAPSRLR